MDNHHQQPARPADATWCRHYAPEQVIHLYAQSLATVERERDQLRQELEAANGIVGLLADGHDALRHYGIDFMSFPSFMAPASPRPLSSRSRRSDPAAVKKWAACQRRRLAAAVGEIDRKIDRELEDMVRRTFGTCRLVTEPVTADGDCGTVGGKIAMALAQMEAPKAPARAKRSKMRKQPPPPLRLVYSRPYQ